MQIVWLYFGNINLFIAAYYFVVGVLHERVENMRVSLEINPCANEVKAHHEQCAKCIERKRERV